MRARNIKPALFKNELLGGADPLITILFEGLWCAADREGRLEDRPARIKAEVFPYRPTAQVEEMLAWLAQNGFIERYKTPTANVIQVIEFIKHQRPHYNETKSILPTKVASASIQGDKSFVPRREPLRSDSLIPDPLLSDSGYLIPDTPLEDSGGAGGKANGKASPKSQGTRLPSGWQPNAEQVAYATEWKLDPARTALEFTEYWWARPGKEATKLDWNLTWRRWCRSNHDRMTGADKPVRKTRFDELTENLNAQDEEDPFR